MAGATKLFAQKVADGHLLELLGLQCPCDPIGLVMHSDEKVGSVVPLPSSPGQFQVRLVRQGVESLGICAKSRIEQRFGALAIMPPDNPSLSGGRSAVACRSAY